MIVGTLRAPNAPVIVSSQLFNLLSVCRLGLCHSIKPTCHIFGATLDEGHQVSGCKFPISLPLQVAKCSLPWVWVDALRPGSKSNKELFEW